MTPASWWLIRVIIIRNGVGSLEVVFAGLRKMIFVTMRGGVEKMD